MKLRWEMGDGRIEVNCIPIESDLIELQFLSNLPSPISPLRQYLSPP